MGRKTPATAAGQLPRPGDKVTVTASLNGKTSQAEIVSITQQQMVVVLTGHVRLQLYRDKTKPNQYVGNQAGMEFVILV